MSWGLLSGLGTGMSQGGQMLFSAAMERQKEEWRQKFQREERSASQEFTAGQNKLSRDQQQAQFEASQTQSAAQAEADREQRAYDNEASRNVTMATAAMDDSMEQRRLDAREAELAGATVAKQYTTSDGREVTEYRDGTLSVVYPKTLPAGSFTEQEKAQYEQLGRELLQHQKALSGNPDPMFGSARELQETEKAELRDAILKTQKRMDDLLDRSSTARNSATGEPMPTSFGTSGLLQQPGGSTSFGVLKADSGANTMAAMPPASPGNAGRIIMNNDTGERYRSNGSEWVKI